MKLWTHLLAAWAALAVLPAIGATEKPLPRTCVPTCYTVNGWVVQAPATEYAITVDRPGHDHPGAMAFRFELRRGDSWLSGPEKSFRSEINTDDYVSIKSVHWYGFQMMIPSDFPIEDNRLVIGQWWSKPKFSEGEPYRSPALAQRFRNGKFSLTLRRSKKRVMLKDSDAIDCVLFESTRFQLGVWHRFLYQVRWDHADGFVNVWLDGSQVVKYRGGVGYDDDIGPAFKFGIYRDDSEKTYVVHFAEAKRGLTQKSVIPTWDPNGSK